MRYRILEFASTGLLFLAAALPAATPRQSLPAASRTGPLFTIVTPSGADVTAPPGLLPDVENAFVRIDVAAVNPQHESWTRLIQLYFRRVGDPWKLIGLERLPERVPANRC